MAGSSIFGLNGHNILGKEWITSETRVLLLDIDNTLYRRTPELLEKMLISVRELICNITGWNKTKADKKLRDYMRYNGSAGRDVGIYLGALEDCEMSSEDKIRILNTSYDYKGVFKKDKELHEGLKRLKENYPIRMFAFTNSHSHHALSVLRNIGVADLFDGIFCTQPLDNNFLYKPDIRCFESVSRSLSGIKKENVIYVDDSEENLEMGRVFGWICFQSNGPSGLVDMLEEHLRSIN